MSDLTDQPEPPGCYRHPTVPTRIVCTRCGRPICPDCMVDAAVGFHCVDCARAGAKETRQGRLAFGGYPSRDPRLTTYVLIGLNVAVWLAIVLTGSYASRIAAVLQLTPLGVCTTLDGESYYPGAASSAACGATGDGSWTTGVARGAWWQVLTNAFVHVEIVHLLLNMVSLLVVGPIVERVMGRRRFLVIYLVSALAASALVMWFSAPHASTLGASGALFGVMGALLLLTHRLRGNFRMVLGVLGLNLVYTFVAAGISWQGHIGGLLGGLAVTYALTAGTRETRDRWAWAGVMLIIVLVAAALVVRSLTL